MQCVHIRGCSKSNDRQALSDIARKQLISRVDGIKFFKSANGVILSDGKDGVLLPTYFSKVEGRAGKNLLAAE